MRTGEWADGLMSVRDLVAVALAISVLAVLSGCGRKAGLDSPYEAAVQARKDAAKAHEPLPPEPTPPNKDKPFILDGLIK
jgi:predicted small lipoprotein YifL